MGGLGADVDRDEGVVRDVGSRLAPGYEVWAGAADGVFDDVGEEGGED